MLEVQAYDKTTGEYFPSIRFMDYTIAEVKKRYREVLNLKYRRLVFRIGRTV